MRFSIALVITLFLISCTNLPSTSMPPLEEEIIELNSLFRITAPDAWNSFKANCRVTIELENLSDYGIIFPQDFNLKIFTLKDGEWIEIENSTIYATGDVLLTPKSDVSLGRVGVGLYPNLIDYDTPITIRIIVAGKANLNMQFSDQKVGAYIDITLR